MGITVLSSSVLVSIQHCREPSSPLLSRNAGLLYEAKLVYLGKRSHGLMENMLRYASVLFGEQLEVVVSWPMSKDLPSAAESISPYLVGRQHPPWPTGCSLGHSLLVRSTCAH